jgi:hypothetical protein
MKNAQRDIKVMTLLRAMTLGFLATATIIAPLDLNEQIEPGTGDFSVEFIR